MVDEEARPAGPGDLAAVAVLARQLRAELDGQRGAELWRLEARPEPLETTLEEADAVVVGTLDDLVVGYAVVHDRTLRDASVVATVEEIYVLPEARDLGVAEAMLTRVLADARARGCRGVDGRVLPGLREGKNLYERFGMSARSLTAYRPL
jgi:GNAT superfamily N-acetyltransferase